jgi:drug/metabolite transporter (DMT)-like permease
LLLPNKPFLTTSTKAHLAVLGTNIFFAANYSLVKYISPSLVKPFGLNIVRVGVSLFLFWLVWVLGKNEAGIRKKHIGRFILCGLTGITINQMLFIKGLTMTSTIHASLLMLCTPLLITVFAFWILKEKLTILKAAGLASGIGGAALLILSKESASESSAWGDLLIIMNAISYTLYFILVKPLMKEYKPVHVTRWVFTFGFIMMLPFGWTEFTQIDWSLFEAGHFAALTFFIICGTFLAYIFNVYGIQHLGAGITGSYIYTQPAFAALIAIAFLHETVTWQKVVAGVLIFVGVFLVGTRNVKRET